MISTPTSADTPPEDRRSELISTGSDAATDEITPQDDNPPNFPANPLQTPADGSTITNLKPNFDWADASDPDGVVSYTLRLSGTHSLSVVTTASAYTPTLAMPNGLYTWTVRAHDSAGNVSAYVTPPFTFTMSAAWQVYLPIVRKFTPTCPVASGHSYGTIPIDGQAADRPDELHADLNFSLRGYVQTNAAKSLVDYSGGTDPNAPQLAGLFGPNKFPGISTVYQVNDWIWSCGTHGCPGPAITDPEVTLIGLVTTPGESISIPETGPSIWDDYKAMVLYAEERRITLAYTRKDSVAPGYSVHLENVCVDPNLLALYEAQTNADGWHVTGQLPALSNNQPLGVAFGTEMQVAIRDKGTFLDPRSRKDWWQGY